MLQGPRLKLSSQLNFIFIYFLLKLSQVLLFDLVRSPILSNSSSDFLMCLCFHQQKLVSNIYFHYLRQCTHLFIDDKEQNFYTTWYHITNVIDKNIFVWLCIYQDFIWCRTFYIHHVIKDIVLTVFNIISFTHFLVSISFAFITFFYDNDSWNSNFILIR